MTTTIELDLDEAHLLWRMLLTSLEYPRFKDLSRKLVRAKQVLEKAKEDEENQ